MKAMLTTPGAGRPAPGHAAPATTPRLTSLIGHRAARAAVTGTTPLIRSPRPPGLHLQLKLSTGHAPGGPQSHPARTHADGARGSAQIHAAASRGIATASSPLPFADRIQPLFGRHDISGIRAHTGPEATASADAMAAGAYATGNDVVFGGSSDLHTVAHEAAHVVQQRGGVNLPGGVGHAGDAYERHADAVADAVVAGRSAAPLLDALPTGGAPGRAIQRVGGEKFGIKNARGQIGTERHERLKRIYEEYRNEIKARKERIIDDFQRSGAADQIDAQTAYTRDLMNAEMTVEGLSQHLGNFGFDLTDGRDGIDIHDEEGKIATIVTGDRAYEEVEAEGAEVPVFKKYTLEGLSETDYVRAHGNMLRRFAYRGITPPEREAYKQGSDLIPINARDPLIGLTGYNYDDTGVATVRDHNISDLAWLNEKAQTNLEEIPEDRKLLALLQARKGTGKLFSARSTPRPITSNHGEPFNRFGTITIDLARVPEADIWHSYKDPWFDPRRISRGLGVANSRTLEWELQRGNESNMRNREIVLSRIPHHAVTDLDESERRGEYEAEFRNRYTAAYQAQYAERLRDLGLAEPAPPPAEIRMHEGHFGAYQARVDVREDRARAAADDDLNWLFDRYGRWYIEAYRSAAEEKWYEENPSTDAPDIDPEVPRPTSLQALTNRDECERAGRLAGEKHFGQSSEQPQEPTTSKGRKNDQGRKKKRR